MRTYARLIACSIAALVFFGSVRPVAAQNPSVDTAALLSSLLGIPIQRPTGKMPELADARLWYNSKPLRSADLHGRVVLIDFWAYDCPSCQEDLSRIIALDSTYRQKGLQVIAVHPVVSNFTTDTTNIRHWIRTANIPYPMVYDSTGKIADAFHNIMYPSHFYVDKQGNIREMSAKTAKQAIEELLAEPVEPSDSTSAPSSLAPSAAASRITEADLVGAWSAQLRYPGNASIGRGWLALWPDHLWWYGGALHWHFHGGARWRLVGDTLWLANDYNDYFHPMIERRIMALEAKGYGLAVMDSAIIHHRLPYPVPDSIYWSAQFRDTVSACAQGKPGKGGCGTWVYKVSKHGQNIILTRLDALSRATETVASQAVLTRDTLVGCEPIAGCDTSYTQAHH